MNQNKKDSGRVPSLAQKKSVIKTVGITMLLLGMVVFAVAIIPETASADPSAPVLDGLLDDVYNTGYIAFYSNATYLDAGGYLYTVDNTSIDPDYVWVAWVISKSYVDNTYGNGTVGTYLNPHYNPCGHNFGDLFESDGQQLKFYNCTNEVVFDAFFDLIYPNGSTPSGYGIPAWGDGETVLTTGDGSLVEYNTSTLWNVNYYYNTDPYDVTLNSPHQDQNYTLHANYTEWESRHIYEIRMNRTLFGGCGINGINKSATELLELHASPNKLGVTPALTILASLGDFVWNDSDFDGIQDDGESGISGVTVNLYNDTDSLLNTTTTDFDGYYKFTHLESGNYYVGFVLLGGYVFSPQYQGDDNALDSDANTATGRTGVVTLASNETNVTLDAGMYQPSAIVPAIELVKTVRNGTSGWLDHVDVSLGDTVRFRLWINNNGTCNLTNVNVTDILPANLEWADAAVPAENGTSTDNGTIWWNLTGTLYTSETRTIEFNATATESGVMLINNANVSGYCPNTTTYVYDDDTASVKAYAPAIELVKTVRNGTSGWLDHVDVSLGDTVRFKLWINNSGTCNLTNVNVTDILPDNLEWADAAVPAENGTSTGNGTIWWNLTGTLYTSETRTIEFNATATESGVMLINNANVSGYCPNTTTYVYDDDTASVKAHAPAIELVKTVRNGTSGWLDHVDVSLGDTVRFRLWINNNGTCNLTNVNVTDILPANLEWADAAEPTENGRSTDNGTIWWNLTGTLYTSENRTIEFNATALESGVMLINNANVSGYCPNTTTYVYDDDTASVKAHAPAIELVKTVRNGTSGWLDHVDVSLGDTVRFKLWINNSGTCNLTHVNVTDILPDSLDWADAAEPTENGTNTGNGTIWWNLTGTLYTSENRTIEFNATATESGVMLINNANVSGYCPNTDTYVYDDDTASVKAISEAPKIIRVEQSTNSPLPGENVTITAHVTGNIEVISVNLTYDTTTVPMTLVSGTATDGYWNATIPGQPAGTTLTIYVTARDEDGNSVSSTPHDKHWTLPPVPVPAINPPGVLALVGLLSIIAIRAIRSTHHKRSKQT